MEVPETLLDDTTPWDGVAVVGQQRGAKASDVATLKSDALQVFIEQPRSSGSGGHAHWFRMDHGQITVRNVSDSTQLLNFFGWD